MRGTRFKRNLPPRYVPCAGAPAPAWHRDAFRSDKLWISCAEYGRLGYAGVSYDDAIDRNSPCSIVDPQNRGSSAGVFFIGTVTLAQSATAAPSAAVVAAICAAEILGLAGFSIIPALLPQFIEAWS
jgi:hypothetical protein